MRLPQLATFLRRPPAPVPLTGTAPGTGIVARNLRLLIDIAYVAMGAVTAIMAIAFVTAIFIPLSSYSISIDTGSEVRQMPLSRGLILFALGIITAYFTGFFAIVRLLRQLFATLLVNDPFQPQNVDRLRAIGGILFGVTLGGWLARRLAATHIAPGALDAPDVTQLFTPAFAIIIVFVLAEVFREGSRLRQESELTI